VATDHDSIDHAYAAKAHPAIHLDRARLSWQHPFNRQPPAPWKIGVVIGIVLISLFVLNLLQEWRVGVHMAHMRSEIRDNIVTLATAANQYMQANNVNTVSEQTLVKPGGPVEHLTPIIGESYADIKFFKQQDPDVVAVRIPNGPDIFFNIHWQNLNAPDFVSEPSSN